MKTTYILGHCFLVHCINPFFDFDSFCIFNLSNDLFAILALYPFSHVPEPSICFLEPCLLLLVADLMISL